MICRLCGKHVEDTLGHRKQYPLEYQICPGTVSEAERSALAQEARRETLRRDDMCRLRLHEQWAREFTTGVPDLACEPDEHLAAHHAREAERYRSKLGEWIEPDLTGGA